MRRSLDETQKKVEDISAVFLNFILDLLDDSNLEHVNMVGIGNSISGGWTAVDK